MRLKDIAAIPHPFGNRIDLMWTNPDPSGYPAIMVVRRERAYPESTGDGTIVTGGIVNIDLSFQNRLDNKLLTDDLWRVLFDNHVFLSPAAAILIESPGSKWLIKDRGLTHVVIKNNDILQVYIASFIDENLKGEVIYYYTLFPYKGDPPQYHFDSRNRVSAMSSSPYNMAEQMYKFLPGIYYRYDTKKPPVEFLDNMLEPDRERGQLRRFLDIPGSQLDQIYSFARAMLDFLNIDKVNGSLLPLLAHWIGWQLDFRLGYEKQRNEIRNAPHIYRTIGIIPIIEAAVKRIIALESRTKEFVHNVFLSNSPERLNIWVSQWSDSEGEWVKEAEPLSLDFAYEGRASTVYDVEREILWLFYHTKRGGRWGIWYKNYNIQGEWTPSRPLIKGKDNKRHPAAVIQGETLCVFWDSYNKENNLWSIQGKSYSNGEWIDIPFPDSGFKGRDPCAVVDNEGILWLFWLWKNGYEWHLRYNRYNGSSWEFGAAGIPASYEHLVDSEVIKVPIEAGKDIFVLFNPEDTNQRFWVFWARRVPKGGSGQTRWEIAYMVKAGTGSEVSDWSEIRTLTETEPDCNDREPAALINEDGDIELYWSSDRDRSWSIWRSTLDRETHTWTQAQKVISGFYSERSPSPAAFLSRKLLIYYSNECVKYTYSTYGATETLDNRYAGSTSFDTGNLLKKAFWRQFEDFQTYTYDLIGQNGKRTDKNWYARDTVGIYLTPAEEDSATVHHSLEEQEFIISNRSIVEELLRKFLPAQVWPLFIIEPPVYKEHVYTYDFSENKQQRVIQEASICSMNSPVSESYSGDRDEYKDTVPGWIWMRSWSGTYTDHRTVDFNTSPIDTKFRTWHTALEAGG